MELQRLVIDAPVSDAPAGSLAVDIHPRLTVVHHDDGAVRAQVVNDLVDGLGPSRDGVHLELVLGSGHPLVLFRPQGGRHRAIDTGRALEVTPAFAGASGTIDLLGRLGLPPETARRALRISAEDVAAAAGAARATAAPGNAQPGSGGTNGARGSGAAADGADRADRADGADAEDGAGGREPPAADLVAHLAGLDQGVLWEAAEQLVSTEHQLDEAAGRDQAGAPVDRAEALDRARGLELATAARRRREAATRSHRRVLSLGLIVAGGCALGGALLLAFDGALGDDGWTAKALFLLAVLALAVALWDRKGLDGIRRDERGLLASLGSPSTEALEAGSGTLADADARRVLLERAAEYEARVERWRVVSGGAPLDAALARRGEVERLAGRQQGTAPAGPDAVARLLQERVAALARVGPVGERLPLVLDEPFARLDPADTVRLLDTVDRLAERHQVVLVTGHADILRWASSRVAGGSLAVVRLGVAAERQPA